MYEKKELLLHLCEQASKEADSIKMLELVKQINQLLDEIHGKSKEAKKGS